MAISESILVVAAMRSELRLLRRAVPTGVQLRVTGMGTARAETATATTRDQAD